MNFDTDTGAIMTLVILWGGFIAGAYYVIRDRRLNG